MIEFKNLTTGMVNALMDPPGCAGEDYVEAWAEGLVVYTDDRLTVRTEAGDAFYEKAVSIAASMSEAERGVVICAMSGLIVDICEEGRRFYELGMLDADGRVTPAGCFVERARQEWIRR